MSERQIRTAGIMINDEVTAGQNAIAVGAAIGTNEGTLNMVRHFTFRNGSVFIFLFRGLIFILNDRILICFI